MWVFPLAGLRACFNKRRQDKIIVYFCLRISFVWIKGTNLVKATSDRNKANNDTASTMRIVPIYNIIYNISLAASQHEASYQRSGGTESHWDTASLAATGPRPALSSLFEMSKPNVLIRRSWPEAESVFVLWYLLIKARGNRDIVDLIYSKLLTIIFLEELCNNRPKWVAGDKEEVKIFQFGEYFQNLMPNLLCVVVAGRVRAAGDIQDVATAVHSPQSTSRRDQSAVTATPQLPHYHGVTSPHAESPSHLSHSWELADSLNPTVDDSFKWRGKNQLIFKSLQLVTTSPEKAWNIFAPRLQRTKRLYLFSEE